MRGDVLDRQADGLRGDALPRPRPQRAPWVCVAGAKGGVGKTMLAVNLGLLLARAGHRTLLVDFDPGCGNVAVHLRLAPLFTLDDVALGTCTPAQAWVEGPLGVGVLGGRSSSTLLCSNDDGDRERALAAVQDVATGFDVVVCDTGAGIGPATLAAAGRADLVIGLATPDPAAMTDAYALCKLLHLRGRPLPHLCVNQVKSRDEAMRTAQKLGAVCTRFLGAATPLLGSIRRDGLLELGIAEQRPFAMFGQGPALDDLRAVCAGVLSTLPPLRRRAERPVRTVQLAGRGA